MNDLLFSEIIKDLRTGNKLTQSELARLIGCSQGTICNWEKGRGHREEQHVIIKKIGHALRQKTEDKVGQLILMEEDPWDEKDWALLITLFSILFGLVAFIIWI